jgi:hypothetical protein
MMKSRRESRGGHAVHRSKPRNQTRQTSTYCGQKMVLTLGSTFVCVASFRINIVECQAAQDDFVDIIKPHF